MFFRKLQTTNGLESINVKTLGQYCSSTTPKAAMQFCWAHLIRDVKFLVTLSSAPTRRFGEKLLATIKHLFRLWHRRDQMPAERWQRETEQAKRAILKVARRPPCRSEAENIAQRFRQHAEHYFRFLETPGVEPTNNAIEQRFRFVVIDRKITQGTRGEAGRRWCERIWTVLATCANRAARRSTSSITRSPLTSKAKHHHPYCRIPRERPLACVPSISAQAIRIFAHRAKWGTCTTPTFHNCCADMHSVDIESEYPLVILRETIPICIALV